MITSETTNYVRHGDFRYEYRAEFPERRVNQFIQSFDRQPGSGCWIWKQALDTFAKRYGATSWKSKSIPAHRLAYLMFVGPIPEGFEVHHKCKTTRCVNPDHLEAL